MGKRNNQNFVVIPTKCLIDRLKQLCPEYGIVLTITEEAYTSRASYLDGDSLYKFGVSVCAACAQRVAGRSPKPAGWKPSGQRVERGLYRASSGLLINADCNGAANIAKKVARQLGLDLTKLGRAALTLPHRYNLFSNLTRLYRKRSVTRSSLRGTSVSIVSFRPMCNNLLESPLF